MAALYKYICILFVISHPNHRVLFHLSMSSLLFWWKTHILLKSRRSNGRNKWNGFGRRKRTFLKTIFFSFQVVLNRRKYIAFVRIFCKRFFSYLVQVILNGRYLEEWQWNLNHLSYYLIWREMPGITSISFVWLLSECTARIDLLGYGYGFWVVKADEPNNMTS